jgi:HNH endonuclease/AP2 domain
MMEIPISGKHGEGLNLLIDDGDVALLQGKSAWMSGKGVNGYPSVTLKNGKKAYVHRLVAAAMGLSGQIDHVNRDKCDARRQNLREATGSQNQRNCGLRKHNTSGLKGVIWCKSHQKWKAHIGFEGVRTHIGHFNCKFEAARAYDRKALELHPIHAATNFSLGLLPECHQEVAQ